MKKLWKYSGNLLLATGILHNIVGLFLGWSILTTIFSEAVVNSIEPYMDRAAIFWFLFSGFMIMLCGQLINHFIKETNKPVPASIGGYLLLLACLGCVMIPVSGFWLVLPQALIILVSGQSSQ